MDACLGVGGIEGLLGQYEERAGVTKMHSSEFMMGVMDFIDARYGGIFQKKKYRASRLRQIPGQKKEGLKRKWCRYSSGRRCRNDDAAVVKKDTKRSLYTVVKKDTKRSLYKSINIK